MSIKNTFFVFCIIFLFVAAGFSGCVEEEKDNTSSKKNQDNDISKNNDTKKMAPIVNDSFYSLNFSVDNYPKVDGSTSAEPLNMLIACKLLNSEYIWSYMGAGQEERRLLPVIDQGYVHKENTNISSIVDHSGTHGSYINLINKTADLILVAREPSEDELEYAESKNVELIVEPCAYDGFVFIVHKNNVVDSLTIEEIQKIYTGEHKNWSDIGGNNTEINPYMRNQNSGSQELMESLVMKDLEMINASEMITYNMTGPFNRVNYDEQGIGYTVYFYETRMSWNDNVKKLKINDVFPDNSTISSGEYPLRTQVYTVIRKDLNKYSNAYRLRDWILNEYGQKVVNECGYVSILN